VETLKCGECSYIWDKLDEPGVNCLRMDVSLSPAILNDADIEMME
jgi:hypothetical protein